MNTKTYILPAIQKKIRKTKICIYHLNGKCIRASNCQFAHSEEELKSPPNLYKTRLCLEYSLNNTCAKESQCCFAHGQEELRWTEDLYKTLPCPYYKKDNATSCFLANTCRWAHGEEELRARTDCSGHMVLRDPDKKKKKTKMGTSSKVFLTPSKKNIISSIDQETRKCCDYDADCDYVASNDKCSKKQYNSVERKRTTSPCNSLNKEITNEKKMNSKVPFKSPKHENISNNMKKKANYSANQIRKTTNRFNQCPQYFKKNNILNSPIQEKPSRSSKVALDNKKAYCEKYCHNGSLPLKEKFHSLYKTFNQSIQSTCPHLSYGNQETCSFSQQTNVLLTKNNQLEEMTTSRVTTNQCNNNNLSRTLLDIKKIPQEIKEDNLDFVFSLNHQPNKLPPYYMYRSSSLTTLQDHLSMQGVLESPSILAIPPYQRSSTQSSMRFCDTTKDLESLKSYDDTNVPYNSLHDLLHQSKNYHGMFYHNQNVLQKTKFNYMESPKRFLVTSQSDLPLCHHDLKGNKVFADLYSNSWTCDMNHCAASQEFSSSISTAYVSCHVGEEKFAQETYTSPPYEPFCRANSHGIINSRSDSFIKPLFSNKKYNKFSQRLDTSDLHSFYST